MALKSDPNELDPEPVPPEEEVLPAEPDPLLRIHRPADRVRVGEVEVDGPERVREAVERATGVQKGWGDLSARDRLRRMAALRTLMGRRADEIADRIVAETGKPDGEALAEVLMAMKLLRHLERAGPGALRRRRVSTGGMIWKRAYVLREPLGVVGIITSWSAPFTLTMEPVLTALAAGNGVVLKPSEHAPYTGDFVRELMTDAGLPEGLVQVVQGRAETGEALARSAIHHLHFIGSTLTGRTILEAAAHRFMPVTLALGGMGPTLVLEDADLDRAARGIIYGAFHNAGQGCTCTGSVYVVEPVYEPLLRRLTRLAEGLRVGSGGRVEVGPMAQDARVEALEDQIRDAVGRGARILGGGTRVDPASNVFLPTVIADVPPTARILGEETPGPVLPVVCVRDEEDAVVQAGAFPMGRSATIWTRDVRRGERMARTLPCGMVAVNDVPNHWAPVALPTGTGDRGRMRGIEGLLELTRTRSVLVRRPAFAFVRDPWWFPYRSGGGRLMRGLIGGESYGRLRGLGAALVRAIDGGRR